MNRLPYIQVILAALLRGDSVARDQAGAPGFDHPCARRRPLGRRSRRTGLGRELCAMPSSRTNVPS